MRFLLVPVIVLWGSVSSVQGAAFTSSASGDFAAAWGGKSPGAGDHVRIQADHTVVIKEALELGGGDEPAITVEGKLVVNGPLTLQSDLVVRKGGTLEMGAGSVLELGKSQVRATGARSFRLVGGKGGRVRIASSERQGGIQVEQAGQIEMTGVGFVNMGPCAFSLSGAADGRLTMRSCLWENYSGFSVDDGKGGAQPGKTSSIEIADTDFRKATGGKFLTVGRGAGPAVISHCTFSGGRGSIYVLAKACVFKDNICDNAGYFADMGANDNQVTGNFFNHMVGAEWTILTSGKTVIARNYFYVTFHNSHTILGGADPMIVRENVIEGYSPPADHIIPNVGDLTATRNILIGSGTFVTRLMRPSEKDRVSTKRNTIYISSSGAGMIHYCEMSRQSPQSAVVSNNLVVDANPESKDRGVWCEPEGPDQVTYLDYNAFFNVSQHCGGVAMTGKKEGEAGFGAHDLANVDPGFVDPSRDMKKWDRVNGGAGTHDHAMEELLKLNRDDYNPKYSVEGLLTYVQQGFVPTNRQLKGAGDPKDGSPDIGAMDVAP